MKNIFSRLPHVGHLGFPIETILLFFLSTSQSDASYQVSSQLAFGLKKK